MAQNNNVAQPVRRFTRIDFTALRFRLTRGIAPSTVVNLYNEDDLEERGLETSEQLFNWLDELRDHLIERARETNPLVARTLEDARLRNLWSKSVIDFICNVGEKDLSQPKLTDPVGVWFKPIISKMLYQDDIRTLGDLKQCIEIRGSGWFKPIERIGPGKARALEAWLASQASLGPLKRLPEAVVSNQVELTPDATNPLVPIERISHVTAMLDGSQGRNRNARFCLISARNDLEAIQAYLYRFRAKEKTLRAYQKELERFLLWCVCAQKTPLSGVLTDECEAYKDFLATLGPSSPWVGRKVLRKSPLWRPFAGPLSPESQRYAIQVLRTFFEWLVRVRYLGGNPWITVPDPEGVRKELEMDIDKALPDDLWKVLADEGGLLDRACAVHEEARLAAGALQAKDTATLGAQYRLARAAILLIGSTGIRREEASTATRNKLKPVKEGPGKAHGLWELAVLGKRRKERTVFMPPRVIEALRAHWDDRGHDFEFGMYEYALLSPVVVPNTPRAREKHLDAADGELAGKGFSPDGIYKLVKTTLERLAEDETVPLTLEERDLLRQTAPHAFRHTFATRAAAHDMPTDVLQRALGHASQTTTSIYVRAERKRSIEEAAKFFGR